MVLTHKCQTEPLATAFVEFLKSSAGQKIFAKWGWDARPVAAVGGAQPVVALSAPGQASVKRRFARLKTNHDGFVTAD